MKKDIKDGELFLIIMIGVAILMLGFGLFKPREDTTTCQTPTDIIQQCDDLRMSLDNYSNLFSNNSAND